MFEGERGLGASGRPSGRVLPVALAALLLVALGAGGLLLFADGASDQGASAGRTTQAPDPAEVVLDADDIVTVLSPDSIPAIDDPVFEVASEATWLAAREPVIALELGGDARAYPLQIMTWHEIVNDKVAGIPVSVTFCPLCNTPVAFERPTIDGEVTTFGTSGKLIHSNLLMYDRATESLWPQVTGVAMTGELKGMRLRRIPARIVSWADFGRAFPSGKVLSRDTGHERPYGENPYPGYDDVDTSPFLFEGEVDGRLAAVERVLGFEIDGEILAVPYFRLKEQAKEGLAVVSEKIGSKRVVIFWKAGTASALDRPDISSSRDVGAAVAYSSEVNGRGLTFISHGGEIIDEETQSKWNLLGRAKAGPLKGQSLEVIDAIDSFWFDWAAFHPETTVWAGR